LRRGFTRINADEILSEAKDPMPVVISLLRGVNVGGHNRIPMDALRAVYASLKLRDARTYVQSGNVIFRTDENPKGELKGAPPFPDVGKGGDFSVLSSRRVPHPSRFCLGGDFDVLSARIEDAIERKFKFRPAVILRTASELRDIIARNPFAKRRGIEPAKLHVMFLAHDLEALSGRERSGSPLPKS
jgi:uncharacterized protein (DUF1697 family)